MKPKHTPVPWVVDEDDENYIYIISDQNKTLICKAYRHRSIEDECNANINLITSAPDLLYALRMVYDGYQAKPGSEFDWGQWGRAARAALNSAESDCP